jgi:hypothetical protein
LTYDSSLGVNDTDDEIDVVHHGLHQIGQARRTSVGERHSRERVVDSNNPLQSVLKTAAMNLLEHSLKQCLTPNRLTITYGDKNRTSVSSPPFFTTLSDRDERTTDGIL